MGNHNRTDGLGQQRIPLDVCVNGALTNGETGILAHIPLVSNLNYANISAFNPTANVTIQFYISRFIAGKGFTSWSLGAAFTPPAFGTSGVLTTGVSLPPAGSTLAALLPNDVIGYQIAGGATVAIYGLVGTFVITPLQDVKTYSIGLV